MHDTLIIIGASGHGKVIADIALKMKNWENIYFLDDDTNIDKVLGLDVMGTVIDAKKFKESADFIVAIGNNYIRKKIQEELISEHYSLATLIHPDATIGIDVEIDHGTVVMAGVIISPSTRIGQGCIINTNSTIEHDNSIAEYVHISPGAQTGGLVTIGQLSWLGIGTIVMNNTNIIDNCLIGAGSVVINSIDISGTYMGIPAKIST